MGNWEEEEKNLSIAVLEMIPVVIAACLFGKRWHRKRVLFKSDNMAVVLAARSWLPKDDHLTVLFRRLAREAIRWNFDIKIVHIAGKKNVDADHLSRGRTREFRKRNPDAHSEPVRVPRGLIRELASLGDDL